MVACSTRAGVGDDAGDRTEDSDLAANRNGTCKTGRQAASDFSLSSAQGIGGAWLRPSTPFDERCASQIAPLVFHQR